MIKFLFKLIKYIKNKIPSIFSKLFGKIFFSLNNVKYKNGLLCNGFPYLSVQGEFFIGVNFKNNNRLQSNPIGRNYKCLFVVRKNAVLEIGDNVGLSGVSIVCQKSISIGNNVKIGANTCIYDTDFHSLNKDLRKDKLKDIENIQKKEIIIGDDVFIGAHTTILKGISIGNGSIVGACSVVTKNIPKNEIWAGNPAKFIKVISNEN